MKFIRVLKANKDIEIVLMDYKDKVFQNSDGTHKAYLLLSNNDGFVYKELPINITGNETDEELLQIASSNFGKLPNDIELKRRSITITIDR